MPRFPYPQGISRKGASSLERVEGGGGGLELGSSHQLLSLPPHPLNHRNHLKLSASLPFQGGPGTVKVESVWVLGSLHTTHHPNPSFEGHPFQEA